MILIGIMACDAGVDGSNESDPEDWVWADIPNSRILLFSRAADPYGYGEIYLLTKQGEIRQIVDNTHQNYNPSITRNGDWIAFHRWMTPGDFTSLELFMVEIGTGTEVRLTNDDFATAIPKWNADGTRLVYSSWRTYDTTTEANIFVLDLTDWSVTQITSDPEHEDNDPSWCGTDAIALKSTRNSGEKYQEEIYIMNRDGSNLRRLSSRDGWESDHDPRCSPDGEWIYFYRFEATRRWIDQDARTWSEVYPVNIWRVNRAGRQEKLTSCEYFCANPVPAADGSVLFLEKDFIINQNRELIGSKARLMIMDANGANPRELLPGSVYEVHASTLEWFDW